MQLQETRPRKIAGALRNTALLALPLLLFISYATQSSGASGSGGGSGGNPGPLSSVAVPIPPDLTTYVANSSSLVQLGKALFWDMQVGNDGKQACASCHFHAGADHSVYGIATAATHADDLDLGVVARVFIEMDTNIAFRLHLSLIHAFTPKLLFVPPCSKGPGICRAEISHLAAGPWS